MKSRISVSLVIPAKAGIKEKAGFRVKPGMTFHSMCVTCMRFLSFEFVQHVPLERAGKFEFRPARRTRLWQAGIRIWLWFF